MAENTPSAADQAAAIRWFAKQPRELQSQAIKGQSALMRQTRGLEHKGPMTPDILLTLLASSCLRMMHEEAAMRMKQRLTQEEAREIHERRIARYKAGRNTPKSSPKRDAIRLKFFSIVQELRQKEGFGWRSCANFLKEQHKFPISHAFLKQTIEELEALQHVDRD